MPFWRAWGRYCIRVVKHNQWQIPNHSIQFSNETWYTKLFLFLWKSFRRSSSVSWVCSPCRHLTSTLLFRWNTITKKAQYRPLLCHLWRKSTDSLVTQSVLRAAGLGDTYSKLQNAVSDKFLIYRPSCTFGSCYTLSTLCEKNNNNNNKKNTVSICPTDVNVWLRTAKQRSESQSHGVLQD